MRRKRQLLNTADDPREERDLDNIARFEPRRETVGELLRRTREIKGHELDAVAVRLRIRPAYLKAIESGRFQDLPGSTYAVGFVRTYADHLGLDSEDVVRRFRDEVAEVNGQTQLIFPVVAAEGKIPRGAILMLSALLGAIAYGGWYYLSERDQSPLDLIPELPAQLRALIAEESPPEAPPAVSPAPESAAPAGTPADTASADATAAPEPVTEAAAPPAEEAPVATPVAPAGEPEADAVSAATASAAPTVSAPAANEAAQAEDGGALEAARLSATAPAEPAASPASEPEATQTAAVPPAPSVAAPAVPGDTPPPAAPTLDSSGLPTVAAPAAPTVGNAPGAVPATQGATLPATAEGQVFGAADAPSRIVLVARLESWVQVTDPETNALLTRVLRAGDRYYVPEQAGLTLATGNAGGLDIWVDGRKLPALGPVGVVRRGIALDPQRLQDGTAVSEAPAVE
jgi:cytoskeleton protein RodZ